MNTAELQRQIDERDELVHALTRQLEQAAEQLDRLQRSGGVAGRPAGMTSLPAEFLKHQEALGQDIAYLVNQWEATQLAGAMGRMELQLEELRDMLTQVVQPVQQIASSVEARGSYPRAPYLERESAKALPFDERDSDLLASLQAAMHAESPAPRDFSAQETDYSDENSWSRPDVDADYHLPDMPELPELVEFDAATTEELQAAIIERDTYIRVLVEQFRKLHHSATVQPPTDWQEIPNAPRELIARMEQRERQLEEQLRLNEISMSIERARLSREATQLELARIQLQKQTKNQGLDIPALNALEQGQAPLKTGSHERQRNQKWLSMLRVKDQKEKG